MVKFHLTTDISLQVVLSENQNESQTLLTAKTVTDDVPLAEVSMSNRLLLGP